MTRRYAEDTSVPTDRSIAEIEKLLRLRFHADRFAYMISDGKITVAWRSNIELFEEAFMAQIIMPDGRTMSEWARPQIELAYRTGKMPPLMIEPQREDKK
jgi:hypothetical protein